MRDPVELVCAGRGFMLAAEAAYAEVHGTDMKRNYSSNTLPSSSSGTNLQTDGPTKRVTEDELSSYNHYELLGLDSYGVGVDDEMIKRAYHKALLLYHPDKQQEGSSKSKKEKGDAVFLAVQKAYDILSNESSRRSYDSTNNFDDDIPSGREAQELGDDFDFYEVYGPVFRSNARFASVLPVPDLGGPDDTEDAVESFYEYWFGFESWRDFGLEASEHDLEQAEDRFEKRWMAKENEKAAKKRKKDEYARIVLLVERARANDPRLKRFAEIRAEIKSRAKRLKEDADLAAEVARNALAAIEKAEKERLEKEQQDLSKERKTARERLKKAKRRSEKAIWAAIVDARALDVPDTIDDATFEDICATLEAEEIVAVAEHADASPEFQTTLKETLAEKKRRKASGDSAKLVFDTPSKKSNQAKSPPWSESELSMLSKAIKRFPAGSRQRWEGISEYLSTQLKLEVPRTKEECIAKYQELQNAPASKGGGPPTSAAAATTPAPAASKDGWTVEQQLQLEAGLQKHPAFLEKNERWKRIASEVQGKSKKECVERYKVILKGIQAAKKAQNSNSSK